MQDTINQEYTINNIRHVVLKRVAQLAYDNRLEEAEYLPEKLMVGPKPNFRCCIYKEREVVRQRVRLAKGMSSTGDKEDEKIVQVLTAACEGCTINRYVVTDNCRKCIGRKCQTSCRFGAVSMGRDHAYIDPEKCKECGACAKNCPYNAIADVMRPCKRSCPVDAITRDENNIVDIDAEKCIECGACIKNCPFGALSEKSFIVPVIEAILAGKKVYAMAAPAVEGQFGPQVTMGVLRDACKQLGFEDLYEVALGADITADSEARELARAKAEGRKMTTSCCPAFVSMIHKHFPQLKEYISTTVSPMTGLSRLLREIHKEEDMVLVFIGPCFAKKSEVMHSKELGSADYAITFEELHAMFEAKNVMFRYEVEEEQQGSLFGKRFCTSGGVGKAVAECLREQGEAAEDYKIKVCNGAAECKTALLMMKAGKMTEDLVEGMACEGGCMYGPGTISGGPFLIRDRKEILEKDREIEVEENLKRYEKYQYSTHIYPESQE